MRDNRKPSNQTRLHVGRYALGEAIAAGGMATLHLGRLVGSAGFARTVAIKRLHPHLCLDPNFVEAFADEARLAARVRHPNVVPTLDVVRAENELLLVMEYVDGDALSALFKEHVAQKKPIPLPVVIAIVSEMLHGLHAAHEAKSETGQPLGIVHRDISPQNVLVGADGVARLVDFGIARATNKVGSTGEGDVKGKLAYMAPEQIRRERVTRQTDIFAAGVVLWELLTGARLFTADHPGATVEKILVGWVAAPSTIVKDLPRALDDIALRALDSDPNNRFESAREMAVALEDALPRALGREVAAWVESTSAATLAKRRALVAQAEKLAAETSSPGGPVSLVDAPPPAALAQPTARLGPPPKPPRPSRPSQVAEVTLHTDYSVVPADLPTATPTPVTPVLLSSEELIPDEPPAIELPMTMSLGVIPPPEPTMTVFSAGIAPHESSSNLAFDPTVHLGDLADSIPQGTPTPYRARRARVVDRLAILIMAAAAAVTLYFGASFRRAAVSASAPTPTTLTAESAPEVETTNPPPIANGTVIGATTPSPSPSPSPSTPPSTTPLAPTSKRPAVRPVIRTNVSPTKTPCIAKTDPVSQKKVYQGDCD